MPAVVIDRSSLPHLHALPSQRRPIATTAALASPITNTLILASLPDALFEPLLQSSLRSYFELHGNIRIWAPLKGLGRVWVVFEDEAKAEEAKWTLDRSVLEVERTGETIDRPSCVMRVFFGPPTSPELIDQTSHLSVPPTDKNFLISPPGSPPVGWEQIREDPPNMDALAEDLMDALSRLSVNRGGLAEEEDAGDVDDIVGGGPEPSSTLGDREVGMEREPTVLLLSSSPSSVPSVLLSEADSDDRNSNDQQSNGISLSAFPYGIPRRSPTPRPSHPITAVKATVESMRGPNPDLGPALMVYGGDGLSTANAKITPTTHRHRRVISTFWSLSGPYLPFPRRLGPSWSTL